MTSPEGAIIGLTGASNSPTLGSVAISLIREFICERPAGVRASPRKSSVTTLASPESRKSSSISCKASATALPWGSVAAVSGGGAPGDPRAQQDGNEE